MSVSSSTDMKSSSDDKYIKNLPNVIKDMIIDTLFNFEQYKKLSTHKNFNDLPNSVIEMFEQKVLNNCVDEDSLWLYKYIDFYCENAYEILDFISDKQRVYTKVKEITDYKNLFVCNEYHHSNIVRKFIEEGEKIHTRCFKYSYRVEEFDSDSEYCDSTIFPKWCDRYKDLNGKCKCGKSSIRQEKIPSDYEDFNIESDDMLYELSIE